MITTYQNDSVTRKLKRAGFEKMQKRQIYSMFYNTTVTQIIHNRHIFLFSKRKHRLFWGNTIYLWVDYFIDVT